VGEDDYFHKVSPPFPVWVLSSMSASGNHNNSELLKVKIFPRMRQAEARGVWQLGLEVWLEIIA